MIDVPADTGADLGVFEKLHEFKGGRALSVAFKEATVLNHGMAGRIWLKWVVENRSGLADQLPKIILEFCAEHIPSKASGQVERVARRFTLVSAAGELLTGQGITGWAKSEAEQAVASCFQDWLKDFGGGQRETANVLRQVKLFLEQNVDSRFEPIDPIDDRRTVINRAGFRQTVKEGKIFLVLPNVFREEVCAGIDHRNTAKVLVEARWIIPANNGKHTQQNVRLPGMSQTRCYVFGREIWKESKNEN